jgi:hypothetical protein
MASKQGIMAAINARINKVLLLAEAALPESQFRPFRRLMLDEFGNSGLGKDLDRLCGEDAASERHGMGRNKHAGKEVPR